MSHASTERAGLQPAPGGLALVQDLLNTRALGPRGTDLLASAGAARRWLREALDIPAVEPPGPDQNAPLADSGSDMSRSADPGSGVPELSWVDDLSDRDLRILLELRSDLQGLVAGAGTAPPVPPAPPVRPAPPVPPALTAPKGDGGPTLVRTALVVGPAGTLALRPAGRGLGWFISAVWIQVYLAQQAGTWRRLKLCHNPPCGSAFYDRSKNNSGVWHDVRVCGNAVNLRASRARRRAVADPSPAR